MQTNVAAPVAPRLTSEAFEKIRIAAWTGLKSLPKRGAEIGGIVASSRADGAIDTVVLVPIEYRFGPSYRLSEADRERFNAALQDVGAGAVGVFRSSTRPDDRLSPDDLAVAAMLPACGLMVAVRPFDDGRCEMRIFVRDDREQEWRETPPLGDSAVPASVPRAPAGEVPSGRRTPAIGQKRALWLSLGLLVAVLIAGAALTWRAGASGREASRSGEADIQAAAVIPHPNDLGLRADIQGQHLRLTWNRQAPALRDVQGGLLRIRDGSESREVKLSAAEVTAGSVLYTRRSDDVQIEMRVNGSSGEGVETVRILGGLLVAAPAPGPSAPPSAIVANPPPTPVRRNQFVPPPARATKVAPENAEPELLPSAALRATMQTAPTPQLLVSSAPQSLPGPPDAARPKQVGSPPPGSVVVVAAKPIRRALPNLRALGLPPVLVSTEIEVEVRLDAGGRVLEATPRTFPKSTSHSLVLAAVQAAKDWVFEPARSGGRPVPSAHVIVFQFKPQ
jgi:hypothetical protein